MKVKVIKLANVWKICENDIKMEKAFRNFYNQLKFCDWEIPNDIIRSFSSADIITCANQSFNRIVFNIGGNKYRMICGYKFGINSVILYIRFVGTHKKYDKVDVCKVNMF